VIAGPPGPAAGRPEDKLDPAIQGNPRPCLTFSRHETELAVASLDCRVEPGNDNKGGDSISSECALGRPPPRPPVSSRAGRRKGRGDSWLGPRVTTPIPPALLMPFSPSTLSGCSRRVRLLPPTSAWAPTP